jgi:hypothetical protein
MAKPLWVATKMSETTWQNRYVDDVEKQAGNVCFQPDLPCLEASEGTICSLRLCGAACALSFELITRTYPSHTRNSGSSCSTSLVEPAHTTAGLVWLTIPAKVTDQSQPVALC